MQLGDSFCVVLVSLGHKSVALKHVVIVLAVVPVVVPRPSYCQLAKACAGNDFGTHVSWYTVSPNMRLSVRSGLDFTFFKKGVLVPQ